MAEPLRTTSDVSGFDLYGWAVKSGPQPCEVCGDQLYVLEFRGAPDRAFRLVAGDVDLPLTTYWIDHVYEHRELRNTP